MGSEPKDVQRTPGPPGSLEQEAVVSIIRTSEQLIGSISEVLKPHGLSVPAYNVLRILRGAGKRGCSCGQIAARLLTRVPDCTRLVDRLERADLARRQRDRKDRRVVRVILTEPGRELLAKLDKPILANHLANLGPMGAERIQSLLNLLAAARSVIE